MKRKTRNKRRDSFLPEPINIPQQLISLFLSLHMNTRTTKIRKINVIRKEDWEWLYPKQGTKGSKQKGKLRRPHHSACHRVWPSVNMLNSSATSIFFCYIRNEEAGKPQPQAFCSVPGRRCWFLFISCNSPEVAKHCLLTKASNGIRSATKPPSKTSAHKRELKELIMPSCSPLLILTHPHQPPPTLQLATELPKQHQSIHKPVLKETISTFMQLH